MYLDNAATAKYTNTDDIVVDTMVNAMRDSWLNHSSLYASNVKDKINKCRANIAKFIGAKPEEIIFVSGASEANNLAIRGWNCWKLYNSDDFKLNYFITTPIEHKSIMSQIGNSSGIPIVCRVDEYGIVDLESLESELRLYKGESILVSVHFANNETGVIQPIKEISKLVQIKQAE